MSDDALHINVVGGSKAEGELKKVAGGYRAIGKAADQAAHSAEKIEREENKMERRTKRRVGDRADMFGKFGGQQFKAGGNNIAQMGAVGLVATIATSALEAITAADGRAVESAARINDEMQTFANSVRTSTAALQAHAAATVRSQSINDRREFSGEDNAKFSKVDAMQKEVDARAKSRLSDDALEGQRKEVFASRNPNLAIAMPQIEAMRQKLDDQTTRANAQGGVAAWRDDLLTPGGSEETKRRRMLEEFSEASGKILDAAIALDRTANSRAASLSSN